MKRLGFGLVIVCLLGVAAFAQNEVKANQGKPGNQGPWPVTCTNCSAVTIDGGVSATVAFDGGFIGQTTPYLCQSSSPFKNNVVGTSAVNMPIDGGVSGRLYLRICNSLQNAGNPLVKCCFNCTPVMAAGNEGDVIGTGDCVTYPILQAVTASCISDTASTQVPSFECK